MGIALMPQPLKREVKYADVNMYNEGVLFYRETFDLTPNRGFRADIAATIKTYADLLLWQDLLSHWGYMKDGKWRKRSPLDVKGMLTVFEFKQREAQRQKDEDRKRREALRERNQERIPARSSGPMFTMRRAKSGWAG